MGPDRLEAPQDDCPELGVHKVDQKRLCSTALGWRCTRWIWSVRKRARLIEPSRGPCVVSGVWDWARQVEGSPDQRGLSPFTLLSRHYGSWCSL